MRSLIFPLLLLFTKQCLCQITPAFGPQQMKDKILMKAEPDQGWQSKAEQYIAESEYFIKQHKALGLHYVSNKKQRLCFTISPTGYKVSPIAFTNQRPVADDWEEYLLLHSISRDNASLIPGARYQIQGQKNELNYNYPGFSIQYINNEKGLRQNFIIDKKLPGSQSLELLLRYKGKLSPVLNGNGLAFRSGADIKLFYADLKVWDATDKPLTASFDIRDDNTVAIVVDDKMAQYPITIDPLNKTPDWTGTATGILPSVVGSLAVEAAYGYTVTGVGDLNNDGFEDIAIGSPTMSDVIAGTGSLASVGAVFVYYGSSTGPSVLPTYMLQPVTLGVGALFGYSISGGDINNDNRSDILIGAPQDNVILGLGSGNIGKAYVFNGATLSPNVSPLQILQLSGSSIIQNGINLSINALFGFSIAVTNDLNGDGKNDMIVGAPTYAGIKIVLGLPVADVQAGGSFVFLSNANNDNTTIVKLDPIKSNLLGIPGLSISIGGLLAGFQVDGVGDYNNDGYNDVVVSAPAGVNAGLLNVLLAGKVLQGSATVYYGTGSGISTTAGALLTATSDGLLSDLVGSVGNIANLFGVSVKGARNAQGQRNGNILVGAPLGGALVNILSLQLKTGTVSVFLKKASTPAGNVIPDQILTSPRNDNTVLGLVRSSLLFGYSLDNIRDVNCDNIADIIVGEPASSGVGLVDPNVAGGSAYIYLGKSNGTFYASPYWSLFAVTDPLLGINAAATLGYSVAGAGRVKGIANDNFVLVGAPGRTLDLGSGLLNLGGTLGTLFGLAAGNNGVGKAHLFDINLCSIDVLPITLEKLRVKYLNGISQLYWGTAQESNSSHFEIERSSNGVDFNRLGITTAAVNSSSTRSYTFDDLQPVEGMNYYRLKVVDKDGKYVYSNTVSVNVEIKKEVMMSTHPNPFTDKLTLSIQIKTTTDAKVELFDYTGKLVTSQMNILSKGLNKVVVNDLNKLPQGSYIIKVSIGSGIFTQKIMK